MGRNANHAPHATNGSAANGSAANGSAHASRVVPVVFLHPRDGGEFAADIGPTTTGQAAIDGLVQEQFLPPPNAAMSYALQLQRTGKTIALSDTLVGAGVADNDRLAVLASQIAA